MLLEPLTVSKILSGSDTEYTSAVDISTSALMDSNYNAYLDELDGFISKLAEKPDILLMNNELLTKTRAAARRADSMKEAWTVSAEPWRNITAFL